MSRKKKKKRAEFVAQSDSITGYMSRLRLPDLKRACILRGIPFARVPRSSVYDLQSWLFRNFNNRIDVTLLEQYDAWFDDHIESGPVALSSRLAYFGEDKDGNIKQSRRDTMMLGVEKTKEEIATFKPRRGSMKSLVFSLIRDGRSTKDVIEEVQANYPNAKEGSIKSWCSKARKSVRAQKELEEENGLE